MDVDLVFWFFIALLIIILVIHQYVSTRESRRIASFINKIPGPKCYPIIGSTLEFIQSSREGLFEAGQKRANDYGPVFRSWNGSTPEVHIMRGTHFEVALNNSVHINKGIMYKKLHPWLGLGLLTSGGHRWHTHRKLLTPTFHFKILDTFFDVFNEKSRVLLEILDIKSKEESFDIYPLITRCTLDIICETAMGVEMNAMHQADSPYVQSVYKISEIIVNMFFKPWLNIKFIFNRLEIGKEYKKCLSILHGFTDSVIKQRKQSARKLKSELSHEDISVGRKNRRAFLDLLLDISEDGKVLSDVDIREEVDTFMFEGHDTTTSSIAWTIFLLGNHENVQNKVAKEIEEILGHDSRPITLQDVSQMKYLDRVIKESLRLYPSVPIISREISEDIMIDEYLVPKGCQLVLQIYDLHRDPEQFPNPDKFDPDNFLPEKSQKRHPFAYIPFSAGPRNCIGQKFALLEEKTIIASIIRKFKIKSIETPETVKMFPELIIRPQNGILVTIKDRY